MKGTPSRILWSVDVSVPPPDGKDYWRNRRAWVIAPSAERVVLLVTEVEPRGVIHAVNRKTHDVDWLIVDEEDE